MSLLAQVLASEGGLPENVNKNDGVFSAVIIVKDGAMLKDTGESRLAPELPHRLAPYDSRDLALMGEGRSEPEILGMSVPFDRPSVRREMLEYEEAMRARETDERRKRLGLPEPKVTRSITGPREGLPPAPEEGDDGNGGWMNALDELLRSVLKDLRVLSVGRRLHGGGALPFAAFSGTRLRECHVFLSTARCLRVCGRRGMGRPATTGAQAWPG